MIYFASDAHLGLSYKGGAGDREQLFVAWLEEIESSCSELFLVGDIFDFWFEWKRVVPKGFVRVFGILARMSDSGVKIHFFAGNHDKWVGDYFEKEIGANVYCKGGAIFERDGVKFYVVHGDGLGKSDFVGKGLNWLFNSKGARWIFQRVVHPDVAMRFGTWWSGSNRNKRGNVGHTFRFEKEPISVWAKAKLESDFVGQGIDYVVVGHLHTPTVFQVTDHCKLLILGEWIESYVYAVLDGGKIELVKFEKKEN